YSQHARNVLQTAEHVASTAPGGIMTCEHLLLSLCGTTDCAASQVLAQCGFSIERVTGTLTFLNGSPAQSQPAETVVLSPRLERVLVTASAQAGQHEADRIDTLHLLGALLREKQGIVAFVLETPGVGLEPIGGAISNAVRNGLTDPS
ncbi:MAG: hypothetical protein KC438_09130, partial [Thermomicrobiales bacterium]|nr:hypothetical protein [Thermomicrobiales bacterium]